MKESDEVGTSMVLKRTLESLVAGLTGVAASSRSDVVVAVGVDDRRKSRSKYGTKRPRS